MSIGYVYPKIWYWKSYLRICYLIRYNILKNINIYPIYIYIYIYIYILNNLKKISIKFQTSSQPNVMKWFA